MNKGELAKKAAEQNGLSAAAAGRVIDTFLEDIGAAMRAGEPVDLHGFGTFKTRHHAATTGRNPRTGDTIEIAARTSIAFSAKPTLKRFVNG